jgi:predicted enzyme related to lactoylglutathione lyase
MPYYVGFRVGDQEIGLDPNGHRQGQTGPIAFRTVDDIQASLQALLDAGGEMHHDVRNVGGGKLTAVVRDPDGDLLGLIQEP